MEKEKNTYQSEAEAEDFEKRSLENPLNVEDSEEELSCEQEVKAFQEAYQETNDTVQAIEETIKSLSKEELSPKQFERLQNLRNRLGKTVSGVALSLLATVSNFSPAWADLTYTAESSSSTLPKMEEVVPDVKLECVGEVSKEDLERVLSQLEKLQQGYINSMLSEVEQLPEGQLYRQGEIEVTKISDSIAVQELSRMMQELQLQGLVEFVDQDFTQSFLYNRSMINEIKEEGLILVDQGRIEHYISSINKAMEEIALVNSKANFCRYYLPSLAKKFAEDPEWYKQMLTKYPFAVQIINDLSMTRVNSEDENPNDLERDGFYHVEDMKPEELIWQKGDLEVYFDMSQNSPSAMDYVILKEVQDFMSSMQMKRLVDETNQILEKKGITGKIVVKVKDLDLAYASGLNYSFNRYGEVMLTTVLLDPGVDGIFAVKNEFREVLVALKNTNNDSSEDKNQTNFQEYQRLTLVLDMFQDTVSREIHPKGYSDDVLYKKIWQDPDKLANTLHPFFSYMSAGNFYSHHLSILNKEQFSQFSSEDKIKAVENYLNENIFIMHMIPVRAMCQEQDGKLKINLIPYVGLEDYTPEQVEFLKKINPNL